MKNNRCLVVGYGSAGQRHTRNALTLGYEVSLVTSTQIADYRCYADLSDAIRSEKPQFIIIASPTYRHVGELKQCIAHDIPTLIEKPLATSFSDISTIANIDKDRAFCYRVAYCLRYHPMIQELKPNLVALGKLYDARLVFGQYLPLWRPGTDFRKCYSADSRKGGGILLDASHEIDLITYLFGPVKRLMAISRKISSLEIESDDLCMATIEMTSGQMVQLALDYYNQVPERRIIVNGENGSVHLDLVKRQFQSYVNNVSRNDTFDIERNSLFVQELDDFVNSRRKCLLPDLKKSEMTLKVFDAIRQSSREEKWIDL